MNTPAFPHQPALNANGEHVMYGETGMTIRQYYKAAALSSLSTEMFFSLREVAVKAKITNGQAIAGYCADMADALLAEDEEHAKE